MAEKTHCFNLKAPNQLPNFPVITESQFSSIASCSIYPGIGICRLGNSDQFFIGPEVPDTYFTEYLRDSESKLVRQAARFRVFGFDKMGNFIGELTSSAAVNITWTAELANKKPAWYQHQGRFRVDPNNPNLPISNALLRNPMIQSDLPAEKRTKLINAPGPRTVSGINQRSEPFKSSVPLDFSTSDFPNNLVDPPYLGELLTDDQGRLIVIGGHGVSDCTPQNVNKVKIHDYANNNYWYDDISDGPVNCAVTVNISGIQKLQFNAERAWVIVAPPKYAPSVKSLVTFYNLAEEIARKKFRWQDPFRTKAGIDDRVEYNLDILPVLKSTSEISWLNKLAIKGHGIDAGGFFQSAEWQQLLSSNSPESEPYRNSVFTRLRKPYLWEIQYPTVNQLSHLPPQSYGEANFWYMPQFAGDNSSWEFDAPNPGSYFSLNPFVYNKFQRWAAGDFIVVPKSYNWNEHPHSLNIAALEWCAGGPFMPGIEITFISMLDAYYSSPFRFASHLIAGDISKWMAVPWQGDFYECRNVWWPTHRPDDVVTEATYHILQTKAKTEDTNFDLRREIATTRNVWVRGFRLDTAGSLLSYIKLGDMDMVKYWKDLGFIVPKTISYNSNSYKGPQEFGKSRKLTEPKLETVEILVETLRNDLAVNNTSEIDQLRDSLTQAMQIEITVMIPYLTAYFSIQDPVSFVRDQNPEPPENLKIISEVKYTLKKVAAQEMLHLVMIGNIMKSIGFEPKLYNIDFIADYPAPLPFFAGELILHLLPASESILETFIRIEKPEPVSHLKVGGTSWSYQGKFYHDLEALLEKLVNEGHIRFQDNTAYQFPDVGYRQETGALVQVKSLADAKKAIEIVIKQGEGSPFDDPDRSELSHYYRFEQALNYIKSNPLLFSKYVNKFDGDKTKFEFFRLLSLPTLENSLIALSAFNAAFCYILLVIENVYYSDVPAVRSALISGMFLVMTQILPNLHNIITTIDIPKQDVKAAPLYYFYNFSAVPPPLNTLVNSSQTPKTQLVRLLASVDSAYPLLNFSLAEYAGHLPEVVLTQIK